MWRRMIEGLFMPGIERLKTEPIEEVIELGDLTGEAPQPSLPEGEEKGRAVRNDNHSHYGSQG